MCVCRIFLKDTLETSTCGCLLEGQQSWGIRVRFSFLPSVGTFTNSKIIHTIIPISKNKTNANPTKNLMCWLFPSSWSTCRYTGGVLCSLSVRFLHCCSKDLLYSVCVSLACVPKLLDCKRMAFQISVERQMCSVRVLLGYLAVN